MWATLLLPVADPASHSHSQSLPVPPSPSLSPSLQVSGANYAGTFEVTRARGTYPTSLPATLPPAKVRYGAVQRSAVVVRWAGPSPAQPSRPFLVPVVVSPSLSRALSRQGMVWSGQGQSSPAQPSQSLSQSSQTVNQSQYSSRAQSSIHSFAQSQSNRSSAWQEGACTFAHLDCHTAPVRHFPPCLHLPPKPAHTLLARCTLHLAPCYHPTSFLPFAVCWLCVDVINVRVRVCLREHERGVELISKFHIRTHPYPYHSQQYPAPAPQPMLPNNCQW